MAAHPAVKAINTQEITDKARRGLLLLLEAVCHPPQNLKDCTEGLAGSRQEEPGHRTLPGWHHWPVCQVQHTTGVWRRQNLLPGEPQRGLQSAEYHLPLPRRECEDGAHCSWYVIPFHWQVYSQHLRCATMGSKSRVLGL